MTYSDLPCPPDDGSTPTPHYARPTPHRALIAPKWIQRYERRGRPRTSIHPRAAYWRAWKQNKKANP